MKNEWKTDDNAIFYFFIGFVVALAGIIFWPLAIIGLGMIFYGGMNMLGD